MVQPPLVVVAELSGGLAKVLLVLIISALGSTTRLDCNVAALEPPKPLMKSASSMAADQIKPCEAGDEPDACHPSPGQLRRTCTFHCSTTSELRQDPFP